MAQLINEAKRLQKLAGIITENEETQVAAAAEKVEDKIEANSTLSQKIDKLTPEQINQIKQQLSQLGVTPDSDIKNIATKIQSKVPAETLEEGDGDPQQKVADTLGIVGKGLVGSLLVPIIPVAIGSAGVGVAAGFAITALAAGALIGLAKLLDKKGKY